MTGTACKIGAFLLLNAEELYLVQNLGITKFDLIFLDKKLKVCVPVDLFHLWLSALFSSVK